MSRVPPVYWIPAFAGMTARAKYPSSPKHIKQRKFANNRANTVSSMKLIRIFAAFLISGQGTSPSLRAESVDLAEADILAIADAAGADQFAWWGYSFGGAAGLQLAARTDRVSALVVGGVPPVWQPFSHDMTQQFLT